MPDLQPGFSKVRLSSIEVVLNPQNQIVAFVDEDGTLANVPFFSQNNQSILAPDGATWCLVWKGTQAEYDAIPVKSATVLYVIV